jgi:serine/threonine protein phosphatase PrpC
MKMAFVGVGVTHPGAASLENEDSVLIIENHPFSSQKGNLFAVADGIGSEAEGLVASDQTINLVKDFFYSSDQSEILEALVESIKEANRKIFIRGKKHISTSGMGSTISAVIIQDNHAFIAHVGDSRVYRYSRWGELQPLTQDDVDEQGRLIRSIGGGYYVEVQTQEIELVAGDLLLLCSDGLTDALSDQEISSVLHNPLSINARCTMLLKKALINRRALDNVSIILIGEERSRWDDIKMERIGGLVPSKENDILHYKWEVKEVKTLPLTRYKSYNLRMMFFVLTTAVIFSAIGIVCGALLGGKFISRIKETTEVFPFPGKISAFDYYSNVPINDFSVEIVGENQKGTITFFPWGVKANGYKETSISMKPPVEKNLNVLLQPEHFVFIDVIIEEGEKTQVEVEVKKQGSKGALKFFKKDNYQGYYSNDAKPGYYTIEAKGENRLFYDKIKIQIDSTLLNDKHALICTLGLANWDTLLTRWEKGELDSASVKKVTQKLYDLRNTSNQITGLLENDFSEKKIKKAMELFDKLELEENLPKSKTLREQNRSSYKRIEEILKSEQCTPALKEEIKNFCNKYSEYLRDNH